MITIEQAEHRLQTSKPYARLRDFQSVLSPSFYNSHEENQLAVDVLGGPIATYTTAPHWIVSFLHRHRDKDVTGEELYQEASLKKYRAKDIRSSIRWMEDNQANVGSWWDSRNREAYYRWYEPDALTEQVQECLDRGNDW